MADTTNFVTQINIDGTICEIKDSVARIDAASAKSTANTAKSTADTAASNATNALNKAKELEKLPRVTVTYSATDTTIKVVTTNTHVTA